MANLVIVESPTKARTLSRFLGKDYMVEATMGHVRDLPEKKLGIDISVKSETEYEFIPHYQMIAEKKGRVAELKKLAQSASSVLLATDPDREGEAIAWHIAQLLEKSPPKADQPRAGKVKNKESSLQRIVFHEITQNAIADALKHPRPLDMQLVDAQQARRVLDRLVGYKLSPLLWNKMGKRWLSAGRVQSVAVRLIVEREREIKAFVPVEYWLIEAELKKSEKTKDQRLETNDSFVVRLTQIDGKKAEIHNKETADSAVSDLQTARYRVANVETKEVRRYPIPPFTTSTLQQAGANRFGWSAKRTMKTAQSLYEEGFITYHRTDSTNLAAESINMVRDYIKITYGDAYLPKEPKLYKTKSKVAQEAHEAIRPTKLTGGVENEIEAKLGREAHRLYQIIRQRFVACQMSEAVFDATVVDVEAKPAADSAHMYMLRANGQVMKFAGWTAVYEDSKNQKAKIKNAQQNENAVEEGDEKKKEDDQRELPRLAVSDPLDLLRLLPQQKFTEPPPRFNEASLIKTLEELGIGRPSTYAPIISTIQDRKYVEKIERRFHPTDLGTAVTDFLVTNFPDIFAVSFTAKMEGGLDDIANGEVTWNQVITQFYAPFHTKLETVFKEADRVKVDLGTSDEVCPECGNPLVYRLSKFGKFLACSTYPECKFTKNIVEKAGIVCPKCGGDIIVKKTRRGKQFYGCGNYPTCTFAAWKKEDILKQSAPQPTSPTTVQS